MTFRPEEVKALATVSALHQTRDLDVTIVLDHGVPWMAVRVCDAAGKQYIVSPTGVVYESDNGIDRTRAIARRPRKSKVEA